MLPEDSEPTQPNGIPVPPPAPKPAAPNAPKEKAPIWELPPEPVKLPPVPSAGGNRMGLSIALVVLGAMLLVLIIVLSLNHSPSDLAANKTPVPSPTATSNPMTPTPTSLPAVSLSDATNVVNQYYLLVGAQQYQNAYKLLSSKLQGQQSLAAFTQSWSGTLQVVIKPETLSAVPASDGMSITFTFEYSQVVQLSDGTIPTKLIQANVTIGYDQSQLRITTIATTDVTPTATPTATPSPIPSPTPLPTSTNTPSPTVQPTSTPWILPTVTIKP